jgi:hypothetical protein
VELCQVSKASFTFIFLSTFTVISWEAEEKIPVSIPFSISELKLEGVGGWNFSM